MVNYLSFIVGTMTSWKNLLIHDTLRCDWLSTMQKVIIYNILNYYFFYIYYY